MTNKEFQTILLHGHSEEVAVSVGGVLVDKVDLTAGFRTPTEFSMITSPSGHNLTNTVPVLFIDVNERLPAEFILSLPQGTREYFATTANLR